jgi:hypothetical protein
VKVGDLCAWQDVQHIFYRVQVQRITCESDDVRPHLVHIYFVDTGAEKDVTLAELYYLPEQFANKQHQAVEVYLCRLRPVDSDIDWTDATNSYIAQKIHRKELEGEIVLSLGNTLWLDPLVQREWLPNIHEWVENLNVRTLLLQKNCAVDNLEHMEWLYEACEDANFLLPNIGPTYTKSNCGYTCSGRRVATQTVSLPASGKLVSVIPKCVESPDVFYVQLLDNQNILAEIETDVNRYVTMNQHSKRFCIRDRLLVLARFFHDNRWYRGKVIGDPVHSDDDTVKVNVFFVDYGNMEQVDLCDILPMPYVLRRTPFQAIECCCIDVEFIDLDWDERCLDFFETLLLDQQLNAQVCRVTSAQVTGSQRYGLQVYKESLEYTIDITGYLVAAGYAKLSSTKLQELYFHKELSQSCSELQQLAAMCCNILQQCQSAEMNQSLQELYDLVQLVCNKSVSSSTWSHKFMVDVLCQTLDYCWQTDVAVVLVNCLQMSVTDNDFHCEEMCPSDIGQVLSHWDNLCHLLEISSSGELFEALMSFLTTAVQCTRCCFAMSERGVLRILSEHLLSSHTVDLKNEILILDVMCHVISTLKKSTTKDMVACSSGIEIGCKSCLTCVIDAINTSNSTSNINIIQKCLQLVKLLVTQCSTCFNAVELIGDERLHLLCTQMETFTQPLLLEGVELLKLIIFNENMTKEVLAKSGIYTTLSRLLERDDLSGHLTKLCVDLRSRLTRLLPQKILRKLMASTTTASSIRHAVVDQPSQLVLNQPISGSQQSTVKESKQPTVHWAQSKYSLLLTVDVKDVQWRAGVVRSTDNIIMFRTVVMSIEYVFCMELYAEITFFDVDVKPSCVYIGIHKRECAMWPRLLKSQHRPPVFLVADIDHSTLLSSDEDDENEDDDDAVRPLALITRNALRGARREAPWATSITSNKSTLTNYLPEAELSNTSSSETCSGMDSDSDIDLNRDASLREDKMLGYYVVT